MHPLSNLEHRLTNPRSVQSTPTDYRCHDTVKARIGPTPYLYAQFSVSAFGKIFCQQTIKLFILMHNKNKSVHICKLINYHRKAKEVEVQIDRSIAFQEELAL